MTGIGKDLLSTLTRLSRGERNCTDMGFLFVMAKKKTSEKQVQISHQKINYIKNIKYL